MLLLAACAQWPASGDGAPPGEAIAPGISLLRGVFVAGAQPDGNTVLLRAPDGLVVIDSGRHAAHAQRILPAADQARQPVAAIVNTHWHLDHVAGNAALRAAYPRAEVLASEAIRDAMNGFLADYRKQLLQAIAQAPTGGDVAGWRAEIARIDAGERLFPTRSLAHAGATVIAGLRVWLGLERDAVSGGDAWLLDPVARVLVAGDLVTLPAPLFDTACAEGWRDALDRLHAQEFDILVPGHGAPMSRMQFGRYRSGFANLLQCAAGKDGKPSCIEAWLRDTQGLFPASEIALARSSLDYYIDLLRAPGDPLARRHCRNGSSMPEPSKDGA